MDRNKKKKKKKRQMGEMWQTNGTNGTNGTNSRFRLADVREIATVDQNVAGRHAYGTMPTVRVRDTRYAQDATILPPFRYRSFRVVRRRRRRRRMWP